MNSDLIYIDALTGTIYAVPDDIVSRSNPFAPSGGCTIAGVRKHPATPSRLKKSKTSFN
jgi:hypothetical protein